MVDRTAEVHACDTAQYVTMQAQPVPRQTTSKTYYLKTTGDEE